jgi:iterative type I PKS product template protein
MAMTLCDYAYRLVRPEVTNLGINVANMSVPKSLIARDDGKSQVINLTATVNTSVGRADLVFSSGSDKSKVEHATCQVFFGDREEWLSEWQRSAYLVQSRIDWLKDAERSGKAHKVGRGLAYKLFSALVDYDQKYRGMEEVILHSGNMEATSRVVFQTTEKDGDFMCSPYWIDSVAHISGFIVNGSDAIDSRENVYISHGWESLRVAELFTAEKTYRSYVRMQPRPGKVMAGDVFVFDEDRVVAVVSGLKFQCIPRKVLDMLLPPVGAAKSSPARQTLSIAPPKTSQAKVVETAQVNMTNIAVVNKKLLSVCSQALEILAEDVGVGIDELVDNIAFSDLGVDSLMSLTVSGRMREQLEIGIHSNDFIEHPTIGAFKTFLARFEKKRSISSDSISPAASLNQSTPNLIEDSSNVTTPLDDSGSGESREGALGDLIRTTIAEEMGLEAHEIADAPDLASIGMDSLMSLSILGRLREKTGLSLPADLLMAHHSICDIERSLHSEVPAEAPGPLSPTKDIKSGAAPSASAPPRLATSILLQGNVRKASKLLWMIPDGGGCATSYVDIPDLSTHVAVFGLNSPYMKVPEEYNCGVVGIAAAFITEIKRRQPTGPYLLAGWSAGGVIALEIVNQLTKNDDVVEKLILIDSPCPDIIEPLPSSLHRWFGSIGLLGDGDATKLPAWLLPHFAASVRALSTYAPEKITSQKCPLVTAIWCEDGVCKLPTDPRPDPFPYGHAQFLLDNRTDFGPNLWDKYLNPERLATKRVPGNHFTMMKRPHVSNYILSILWNF